jgi:hypothetical protein
LFCSPEPSLLNITREDTNPTRAGRVQFALSFDEPVSGVDTADFALTVSGGISGQAIQDLWESGGVYHVAVSTGSCSGTIRLDLVDNGSITDLAGNPLVGSGGGWQDGRYSGGETYEIDRTIPVAELLNPDNLQHSGNMPYTFTVRFTDNLGIDPAVFGDANIRMVGTGFNQLARKVKVIEIAPGTQYEVIYQVDPPGKGWELLSTPSFDLTLEPDQIHDLCGNYLGEETLGIVVKNKIYFYMPFI